MTMQIALQGFAARDAGRIGGRMGTQRGMIALLVVFVAGLAMYLMTQKPPGSEPPSRPAPDVPVILEPDPKSFPLSSLKGKVVVLDFWATWCGPCRESIPEVERIYRKYKGKAIQVIGVSEDNPSTQGNIPQVQQALGMTYPIMIANKAPDIAEKYSTGSIPALYVIDKEGKIRDVESGFDPSTGLSKVDDLIARLLEE